MFKIISTCHGGGYQYCQTSPVHPKANAKGLYPLHRVKMENKLGRHLKKYEIVHHIDGDKQNNFQRNLVVLSRKDHSILHGKLLIVRYVCDFCRQPKLARNGDFLYRKRRNTSGVFCSLICSGRASSKFRRKVK